MAAKPRRVSKARTGSAPFLRARELDHVNIKVSDMSASLDFYVGFLGLSKDWEELDAEGEPDFVQLRAGSQMFFLSRNRDYRPPPAVPDRGLNHVCVVVEPVDVDALLAEAERRGLIVRTRAARRRDERGASISTYVEDPDGHGVEIKQYADPA